MLDLTLPLADATIPQITSSHDRRLEMFGLGPADEACLDAVHEIISANVDQLIALFYDHLLSFGELARFLSPPEVLHRQRAIFRNYLRSLGVDANTSSYHEGRLRIGLVHERIGVPIKGYLGACAYLQECLLRLILEQHGTGGDSARLVTAINKVMMLDASLAVEAYHTSALARSEELMHQLEKEKEEICRLAQTDHLTGLLNRRFIFDRLDAETQRCQRYGNALCVLMMDLDNFKTVNDTHGHDVGDAVLQTVGTVLQRNTRKTDKCGRIGGEEFVAVLVETDLTAAELIAERLRLGVLREEIAVRDSSLSVSISIGIAQWNPRVSDAAGLLKKADAALYAAKGAGKNCVRLATED